MKFVFQGWKVSAVSFFIMPIVMLSVILLFNAGLVDKSTEIPGWGVMLLDLKISSDAFLHTLFYSIVAVAVLNIYFITHHDLSEIEQASVSNCFDLIGGFLVNTFYFWAGLLLSWSIGSRVLDFIEPVADQEWGVILSLVEGFFFRVFITKFKDYTMRGVSMF